MVIRIPISVKMVITDDSKEMMLEEIEGSIQKIKLELDQLQFQQKKLLADAQKKGMEAVRIVQDRIGYEHQRRKEKLDRLVMQLEQISNLSIGDEILHSTVESEINIEVGDSWNEIQAQKEIVIKDGIIIDIRRGG